MAVIYKSKSISNSCSQIASTVVVNNAHDLEFGERLLQVQFIQSAALSKVH